MTKKTKPLFRQGDVLPRAQQQGEDVMTKKTKPLFRQGDVLLVPVAAKRGGTPINDPRGLVLAEGETSGHFHAVFPVTPGRADLTHFDVEGWPMLKVGQGGAIVRVVGGEVGGVPRHTPVTIPPGSYEVRIQQQWSSAVARRVED